MSTDPPLPDSMDPQVDSETHIPMEFKTFMQNIVSSKNTMSDEVWEQQ